MNNLISIFLFLFTFQAVGSEDLKKLDNEKDKEKERTRVIYKKTETHTFSDLKLKGEIKKPDLSYIYQRKGIKAEQIVNIPEDFNKEIIQGADQF